MGMPHVVITGGTRGLGLGLAKAFAARGCRVTVGGRTPDGVHAALERLRAAGQPEAFVGQACDVTSLAQLEELWRVASARGPVDVWINNAGINARPCPFWEMSPAEVKAIVDTNLTGAMQGALVAIRGMRSQGHGSIYSLEGLGADGRARMWGLLSYGASKAGAGYFSRGLAAELGDSPVRVGTLDPGIVITDMLATLLADPSRLGGMRRVIEALAQPVDVVAPRLVARVLANPRSGARLRPFGPMYLLWRLLLVPFVRRPLTLPTVERE